MTSQEFAAQLKTGSGYRTPAVPAGRRAPAPAGWRTAGYHALNTLIYLRAWSVVRLGRWSDDQFVASSFRMLRAAERFGGRVEALGMERLAEAPGAVVVVGNHMSSLETSLLACLIVPFKPAVFVVKASLLRYPLMGPILKAQRSIAVARRHARDDLRTVLERGEELLRAGVSVVVFPQSTRSTVFDAAEFNTLGVKLAARAGVPVVPLALKTDFYGNGRWIKDLGRIDPRQPIRFAFGSPLPITGNGKREHQIVVQFVAQHMMEWSVPVRGL
jgi:1-acyl-sn-glycerol-3-phosphate acyltransferase